MGKKFLDNLIPDRIRIIKEDKDPLHVYELFEKHFGTGIEDLKTEYTITLDTVKTRIFITGREEAIYTMFLYLEARGIQFEEVGMRRLRIDLDHFFTKIY